MIDITVFIFLYCSYAEVETGKVGGSGGKQNGTQRYYNHASEATKTKQKTCEVVSRHP